MTANRIVILIFSDVSVARLPADPDAPRLIELAAKIRRKLQARLAVKPCITAMVISGRLA
ncbi:hypothetical protein EOW77_0020965 [Bradyrhizobium yuanmingense]|uniref:hypothetical protein n=1 Tax=Bradyrhizobium yuanmingense TaxID=108015 RepID=UPI000FE442EB|nr:hypothetical protein [Bradyrhizobium yuanmingense]TGN85311.1 hypothetical protein EOW77_0020965 [Bradyrhizobium yuanmingense]